MTLLIVAVMHYILSTLFHLKHFIADFPLQNEYMLGKFKLEGWVKPLAAHCAVHAIMTFGILILLAPWLSLLMVISLSVMDFCIHFTMDRIKASPNMLGKFESLDKQCFKGVYAFAKGDFKSMKIDDMLTDAEKQEKIAWGKRRLKENKYFWWSLGVDQLIHGLTHELIVIITILMLVLGVS